MNLSRLTMKKKPKNKSKNYKKYVQGATIQPRKNCAMKLPKDHY